MVSIWWIVVALLVGTCTGVLAVALMRMSGGLSEPSATVTDSNELRMMKENFLM